MAQPPVKHFAHFTEEELKNKSDAVQKKTLLEMKRKLLEVFKAYVNEISSKSDNFFTFTESELDQHLAKFWFFTAETEEGY